MKLNMSVDLTPDEYGILRNAMKAHIRYILERIRQLSANGEDVPGHTAILEDSADRIDELLCRMTGQGSEDWLDYQLNK